MASQDLLEILGSGAIFSGKSRRKDVERRRGDCQATGSVGFFRPAAAASGKKRRRETDGDQSIATSVAGGGSHETPSSDGNGIDSDLRSRPKPRKKTSAGADVTLFHPRCSSDAKNSRKAETAAADMPPREAKSLQIRTEEVACFRRRMGIRVKGDYVSDPMETFGDMPNSGTGVASSNTRRILLKNVEESAWKEPTPVQMQAVPVLVAGRDLLAAAPTGSGKTAAFVMPMILRIGGHEGVETGGSGVRGILLAPTRELAAQIHRDVVRLSRGRKLRVCLLTKAGAAKAAAATGIDRKDALSAYDIVVTTPMRLVALIRDGAVSLSSVKMVVLDEADKLFDAGTASGGTDEAFVGQVDEILAACSHRDVQRTLFSATIGAHVSIVHAPLYVRARLLRAVASLNPHILIL